MDACPNAPIPAARCDRGAYGFAAEVQSAEPENLGLRFASTLPRFVGGWSVLVACAALSGFDLEPALPVQEKVCESVGSTDCEVEGTGCDALGCSMHPKQHCDAR